jgi:hypothetical protein
MREILYQFKTYHENTCDLNKIIGLMKSSSTSQQLDVFMLISSLIENKEQCMKENKSKCIYIHNVTKMTHRKLVKSTLQE